MKTRIISVFLLLIGAFCFAKENTRQTVYSIDEAVIQVSKDIADRCETNEIIAILDFSAETQDMGTYLNTQITSAIFENSKLRVVTRQNMDKVNEELEYQISGFVSEDTAISICQRLGAQQIVFGQIEEFNNGYMFQVKMLDVKTGSYSLFKKYDIRRSSKTEQLLHHAATIYKSALGLILEGNKNSVSSIAPAVGIVLDYNITRRFSVGAKVLLSYDAFEKQNTIYTIEPLCFLRWYMVSPTGEPSAGLFAEMQCGEELLLINSDFFTAFSGGLSFGFRIPTGSFYFEPFLRGGYPYMFGAGINAGFRF